jgi:hypothetical protein
MREKILTTRQLRLAMIRFYGLGESLKYVLDTIEACVEHNWLRMSNVCPEGRDGVMTDIGFVFEYIGDDLFKCKTKHKELLNIK